MTRNQTIIGVLLAILLASMGARADLIFVNTLGDELNNDGDCSLREAVESANTNTGVDNCAFGSSATTDDIFILVAGEIALSPSLGPLELTERVTLIGLGSDTTTLSRPNNDRLLVVDFGNSSHDFRIEGMRLTIASPVTLTAVDLLAGDRFEFDDVHFDDIASISEGAAIQVGGRDGRFLDNSAIEITDSRFTSLRALSGAAIYANNQSGQGSRAFQSLVIRRSEFRDNSNETSFGSALTLIGYGGILIEDSQFIDNSGFVDGIGPFRGTVFIDNRVAGSDIGSPPTGLATIRRTSFIDNSSPNSSGPALSVDRSNLAVTNSTFVGNVGRPSDPGINPSVNLRGQAITLSDLSTGTVRYSTFIDNGFSRERDSPLWSVNDSTLSLLGNIIQTSWDQNANGNCVGTNGGIIQSQGYNLDSSNTCGSTPSDLSSVEALTLGLDAWGDSIDHFDILTVMPNPFGLAVDSGELDDCSGTLGGSLSVDGRGQPRPVDGTEINELRCDRGAVEYQFEQDPVVWPLVVEVIGNGSIVEVPDMDFSCSASSSCTGYFEDGAGVQLQASAANGWLFAGWSGSCSGSTDCELTMNNVRNVTATFVEATQPLSVSVLGNGTVASNPGGIVCPGTCSTTFVEGNIVELAPIPDPGFELASWGGDCGGTGSCMVTMDQPRNVTATFESTQVPLTVRFEGPGTGRVTSNPAGIDCTSNCSASFPPATTVDLTAIADVGNTFQNWTGACGGTGTCSVTLDQAASVGAVFNDDDGLFVDSFE